jgi:trigger factor
MNIVKEQVDALNALLKVEVKAEDYQEKVEAVLSNYRKTASIPGFRKGKVPAGMIRKQYETPTKIEEVNKLLQDAIYKFISEEKLDILGNPLPKDGLNIDWATPGADLTFTYELGLSPKVDVKITKKNKLDYFKIKADEKMIDGFIENIAKRYGKMASPEEVTEGDLMYGEFVEVDENGNDVEGGIIHNASLSLETVKDAEVTKALLGASIGTAVTFNVKEVFENEADIASMLNIEKDIVATLESDFRFTIATINRMEAAEINQELFDKVFGPGTVKDEKEFRAKVAEDSEKQYAAESDRKFHNDVVLYLIDQYPFDLPNEFLKRWLVSVSKEPITIEQLEAEYDKYSQSLKWQIIESKLAEANDIKVTMEDINEFAGNAIRQQMQQFGHTNPTDAEVADVVQRVLQNQEEMKKIQDQIFVEKTLAYFKEAFGINEKEVSFDEFVKLANESK